MFTGIGGFELGIHRAFEKKAKRLRQESEKGLREQEDKSQIEGIKGLDNCSTESQQHNKWSADRQPTCVGYSEIDKYSIQTYQKNFGTEVRNYGDATKIKPEELPDFDMLCGGFPCQAFSIAGKRQGFEDTRGTLFFDIERILKVKRPKIIFLENVKGLLSHEKGQTFRIIVSRLEALGYNTQWMVLNSKFFGVPQNRERVFIIGSLRGTSRPEILPFRQTDTEIDRERVIHGTITEAIARQGSSKEYMKSLEKVNFSVSNASPREVGWKDYCPCMAARDYKEPKVVKAVLTPDRLEKRQNGRRFKEDGEPMFTLNTQDKHGIFDDSKIRRLTPIECERLQGFPDNWTEGVSDTQRYKQLGNAVTVNVIEAIVERLIDGNSL